MEEMRIAAVKCLICDKLHEQEDTTYFKVLGNINIGEKGGIVGDNLSPDHKVLKVSIYCCKCLIPYLAEAVDKLPLKEENER